MQWPHTILPSLIMVFSVLIAALFLTLIWFPSLIAFYFTISTPFLLFLPGFFILKIFFLESLNLLEQLISAVILSFTLTSLALFLIENISTKLTLHKTLLTILILNCICLLSWLAYTKIKKFLTNNTSG